MKRNIIKLTACVMAALMLFGSAPAIAVAGLGGLSVSSSAIDPDYSGTCGANAVWQLFVSSGKLVISGSGAMDNYRSNARAPWDGYKNSITSAEISDGITSIGSYAFRECTQMQSVSIADTVQKIGQNAFGMSGITEITIPENVTYIGNLAFGYCKALTQINYNAKRVSDIETSGVFMLGSADTKPAVTVVFGNAVERIPGYLFYFSAPEFASNITSVTLGRSIKEIGGYAFYNCQAHLNLYQPMPSTAARGSADSQFLRVLSR